MQSEIIEKFMIYNDEVFDIQHADNICIEGVLIYEVVRVIDKIPLFIEHHFSRLLASAKSVSFEIGNIIDNIKQSLKTLIAVNDYPAKNIKIIVYKNAVGYNYVLYFLKSNYPTYVQYTEGVPVITYKAQRDNPNAKIINNSLREKINTALKDTHTYEAILINENSIITEGSRSNIFFAVGNSLYTAPENMVLIGITRVFICDICKNLGINLFEQPISIDLLNKADGLFLTGTSPKVLPINKVDGSSYASSDNILIKQIMSGYNDLIKAYVENHKEIENK